MYIPFIGRLHPFEYLSLALSILLIFLESLLRIITLALPTPIIHLFYRSSRRLFNYLSSPQGRKSRNKKKAFTTAVAQANDFVELCELFGYYAEEHVVQTGDGYLLGLHRLAWRRGEEAQKVNQGEGSLSKRVVYLHHGLMMNSEVWVCLTERERCLPFALVDRGYDVWLGNNRGNKYSKKSNSLPPTSPAFWSFSIDQFAFHDIPDSISYILSTTSQPSLSYIGFSQGTAQAFATLSIHPVLNSKVDLFIALAPAMSPSGLTNGIVDSLVKANPEVLFLAFGRRSILSSTTMWQAILYPPIFVRVIDWSLGFLFGWQGRNIPSHQKLAAYPHLYSFTSTKSVVHWFQIIRNGTFQMYDDEVQGPLSLSNGSYYYKVAKFPTRNIRTPIVLVYGGSDSLVDINVMLKELPRHTIAKEIPHYEHLDFLWAGDVEEQVFPYVFNALERHADGIGQQDQLQQGDKDEGHLPSYSEEEPSSPLAKKHSENVQTESRIPLRTDTPTRHLGRTYSSPHRSANASVVTDKSSRSHKPEGWWSSDSDPLAVPKRSSPSRTSVDGGLPSSPSETRFGDKGITVGTAKATVGGSGSNDGVEGMVSGSGGGGKRKKKKGLMGMGR